VAVSGGDDYELCFTAPKMQMDAIQIIEKKLHMVITICIEALKNYLYYAPHWAGIISLIGIIVLPFIALFSSLEKLKLFIKPIELSLIKH
jgi:hypothetical protein